MTVDAGRLTAYRHPIHGFFEVDVTKARSFIRERKEKTGEKLSFTAYVISCFAKTVAENKHVHACRDWRSRLVLFNDVSVNTFFDAEVNGEKVVLPHIIKDANKKTFREIHEEIRAAQAGNNKGGKSVEAKFISAFTYLPWFLRKIFYLAILRNPRLTKEYFGTVALTAVGMFGDGGGWGIPLLNHTLCITLGGISEAPVIVDGKIETRELLCVTISIDHDIVDGAAAARFTKDLKKRIEEGGDLTE
ncbi:MAG: 2-oxo acid dehydrogenase subunit E2 [bacterium]